MIKATKNKSDRTWPLPKHSHAMRMRWHDLLFMHWPIAPNLLQQHLPNIECDTIDGQAWIGVVPFRMSDVAPRFVPAVPGLSAFPELNVRTYVTVDGKPGVWFFSLDATNKLAVRLARKFFYLPYMDARMQMSMAKDVGSRTQAVERILAKILPSLKCVIALLAIPFELNLVRLSIG